MSKKLARDPSQIQQITNRYKVTSGHGFALDRFASDDLPGDIPGKDAAKTILAEGIERLSELQELLYADKTWSLLIIIQAMDAGGKDSTIKHVMSGINPQGVAVTSFKAPNADELAHDFLWRVHRAAPARGMIGVFNRSHYEDVLVTRVHEELLDGAHLPTPARDDPRFWRDRIADIAAFESYLARQGTRIVKFFLNVGADEQKTRLLARLDTPEKAWKFDAADLRERAFWPRYREAYQEAIAGTATPAAPWYVVPADRKWFTRLVVAEAIIEALEHLDLKPPVVPDDKRADMERARRELEAE